MSNLENLWKLINKHNNIVGTVAFVLAIAFVSYTPLVSPEYRTATVIPLIAGAIAYATGFKDALLAYAKRNAAFVADTANRGVNFAENAIGRNFVPDDLQALAKAALERELRKLDVSTDTQRRLDDLEKKLGGLL